MFCNDNYFFKKIKSKVEKLQIETPQEKLIESIENKNMKKTEINSKYIQNHTQNHIQNKPSFLTNTFKKDSFNFKPEISNLPSDNELEDISSQLRNSKFYYEKMLNNFEDKKFNFSIQHSNDGSWISNKISSLKQTSSFVPRSKFSLDHKHRQFHNFNHFKTDQAYHHFENNFKNKINMVHEATSNRFIMLGNNQINYFKTHDCNESAQNICNNQLNNQMNEKNASISNYMKEDNSLLKKRNSSFFIKNESNWTLKNLIPKKKFTLVDIEEESVVSLDEDYLENFLKNNKIKNLSPFIKRKCQMLLNYKVFDKNDNEIKKKLFKIINSSNKND